MLFRQYRYLVLTKTLKMSEKHVSMANVIFFLHKGGGVGDEVSIFQWGTSCLDGRGHPVGNLKKITIELGGVCLTNYEKTCNMAH